MAGRPPACNCYRTRNNPRPSRTIHQCSGAEFSYHPTRVRKQRKIMPTATVPATFPGLFKWFFATNLYVRAVGAFNSCVGFVGLVSLLCTPSNSFGPRLVSKSPDYGLRVFMCVMSRAAVRVIRR